jgi:hypothetical protein
MPRTMADIVPAHNAITACQHSRISGSAAMALISLCHSVIQSCASLRGSGRSRARDWFLPDPVLSRSAVSQSLESCPVSSIPASITMPHSSSSRGGP